MSVEYLHLLFVLCFFALGTEMSINEASIIKERDRKVT
jgi:hypothetical protein